MKDNAKKAGEEGNKTATCNPLTKLFSKAEVLESPWKMTR